MTIPSFSLPSSTRVAFGVDRIAKLGQDVSQLVGPDAAVLLVADPGLPDVAARIADILKNARHRVEPFTDVRSDPLAAQVDAAAAQARKLNAACVVGVGGGSTMDVSKLAAAIARAEASATHYELAKNALPKDGLRKICIPTTAGTGSETTRVSVFTNAKGEKMWAWGDELRADLALLDPRLTVGLPPHLTAATGVDALVHAIEACTIRRANLFNDAICYQAIRLVTQNLKRAVETPDDLDARGAMQIAAAAAGMAIDNSGTGIAHAMGHALGAVGQVHHGRAVGLCLRAAIAWNAEVSTTRHALVAQAMGVPTEGHKEADVVADLAPTYDRFLRSVGLAVSLAKDGLGAGDVKRLAATTMAPENKSMRDSNIREIKIEDAERIAHAVLTAA